MSRREVREVVEALNRIAFLGEVLEEPGLRPFVYAGAARTLRAVEGDFEAKLRSGELAKLRGVGPAVLEIAEEVARGEQPLVLRSLLEKAPAGLLDVRRVPGLGPKKIRTLWRELGITTLGELEYACNENRLLELKGFGKATQQKVREAVAHLRKTEGHLRLDQMLSLAQPLLEQLAAEPEVARALVVGGARRGLETLSALELLVLASDDERPVLERLVPEGEWPEGEWPEGEGQAARREGALEGTRVVLHLCTDEDTFGCACVFATGSDAHVGALVERAAARGLRLERGGLWRGAELVPCREEDEVYRALGLLPVTPERREAGVPLVEEGKARPRLVRRADLQGALHNHTTASDGVNTLEEMRDAAAAPGLGYLGITDHSQTASYAGGLEEERLLAQREAVAKLNAAPSGCFLLQGVESDILREGELDYPDAVLAQLDVVVASVHNRFGQQGEEMTARMCRAARHPHAHVVGHPTGRLLLGRPPSEYDVEALLEACAEAGTAVELNANPARLDLNERWLAAAKERGVPVSIGADAHSVEALGHLEYGVTLARRAGLVAEDVLNARSLAELRAWLDDKRRIEVG